MNKPLFSRAWVGALVFLYLFVVFCIVFVIRMSDLHLPEIVSEALHSMQQYGLPENVRFGHVEAAANVLLFVPLGVLMPLWFKTRRWITAWLMCFALSVAIESVQILLLSHRVGSVRDVICNGIGAGLGVLLTWVATRNRVRRDNNPPVQYPS